MRLALAAVLIVVTAEAAGQEPYVTYLQQQRLLEVAECATKSCIHAVLARAPYLDPPLKLIAASRMAQIDGAAARSMLLEALPTDPVAFWFCYSVTVPSLGAKFKKVSDLYDLYFPAAATAAAETGSHVREFLLQQTFADGGIAATIAEDVRSLKERNSRAYCEAFRKLHAEARRYVPGCGSRRSERKE